MSFLNCCRANEIKNDFILNNEKTDNSKKEISNSIISFDNKSIKKKRNNQHTKNFKSNNKYNKSK